MESINRPPMKLLFGTPEFVLEGVVQSTVRVGAKWRDDLAGKGQVVIPAIDLETNEEVGKVTVVGSLYGSFRDFGYIGSIVNHQEDCRDYDGLVDVLRECYPEFDPETDDITVIFFKYDGDNPVQAVVEEFVELAVAAAEPDDSGNTSSDDVVQIDGITKENLLDKTSMDKDDADSEVDNSGAAIEARLDAEADAAAEIAAVQENLKETWGGAGEASDADEPNGNTVLNG